MAGAHSNSTAVEYGYTINQSQTQATSLRATRIRATVQLIKYLGKIIWKDAYA
ncbi:MAG: hypothetical protein QM730_08025 [Anaerolineales bacterium]